MLSDFTITYFTAMRRTLDRMPKLSISSVAVMERLSSILTDTQVSVHHN